MPIAIDPDNPPPRRPPDPDPADCCGGGCVQCVFDLHEAAMERYERELEAWRARGNEPSASE